MGKIKIGVAGCGDLAHIRYFYALRHLKESFELIGVHDYNPEVCKRTAEEFGVRGYEKLEDMLAVQEMDAVIIATFHPSHAEIAIKSMKAGKHVLIEKPFATSSADAFAVGKAAKETKKMCMALPFEIYPNFVMAKKMIEDGTIGEVASADGVFAHHGPLHAPWFFDRERAQWGVLADLGIYPISVLMYLLGPAKYVTGKVGISEENRISLSGDPIHVTVEDNAAAILEWENGAVGTVRTNWCTATDKSGCLYYITIYGNKGIIYINMLTQELIVYSPYKEIENAKKINYLGFGESYLINVEAYDDHCNILSAFHRAIETGVIENDGCNLERQIHVIETIDKLYEASRTGIRQML